MNICDSNNALINGRYIVNACHGHQMPLLSILQADNDTVVLVPRAPQDSLALPGRADHLLADLSIPRNRCQQVVELLPVLFQSVSCFYSRSTNLFKKRTFLSAV